MVIKWRWVSFLTSHWAIKSENCIFHEVRTWWFKKSACWLRIWRLFSMGRNLPTDILMLSYQRLTPQKAVKKPCNCSCWSRSLRVLSTAFVSREENWVCLFFHPQALSCLVSFNQSTLTPQETSLSPYSLPTIHTVLFPPEKKLLWCLKGVTQCQKNETRFLDFEHSELWLLKTSHLSSTLPCTPPYEDSIPIQHLLCMSCWPQHKCFYFLLPCLVACGILVPWSGWNP